MAIDEALLTTGLVTLLKACTGKDYVPAGSPLPPATPPDDPVTPPADPTPPVTPPARKNPIGINSTAKPDYFSRNLAVADAAKGMDFKIGYALKQLVDSSGKCHAPAGEYTLNWEGSGLFQTPMITGSFQDVPAPLDGKLVFDLPTISNEGFILYIKESDAEAPLRNFRLWMPGYAESKPLFRDEYLASLSGFGCIRFMDDTQTNGSALVKWADRPHLDDQQWDGGVPYEALIELANEAKADPWFCIPVGADDDFVAQFATLVKATLDPSLRVYLELSNELWNWDFEQSRFETTQDCPDKEIFFGHTSWVQYRSQQIFRIFEGILGAERLFRVIGGQFDWGNADHADFTLTQATKYAGGAVAFDGLAIAPYLDQDGNNFPIPVDEKGDVTISVADYLAHLRMRMETVTIPMMKANAAVAAKHGTSLIAYEAGLGLQSSSPQTKAFVEQVNQDPGMFDLYTAYLDAWFACGGKQINFYNLTGDVWGQQAWADSPIEESQKLRALKSYKAKA